MMSGLDRILGYVKINPTNIAHILLSLRDHFYRIMTEIILSASTIGLTAQQAVLNETAATVLGSISKGIYLLTPGQRVIFISFEPYCSPLTINLLQPPKRLPEIEVGEPVRLSPVSIDWLNGKITINLSDAEIWNAPASPPFQEIWEPVSGFFERLVEITTRVLVCKDQQGFAPLLLPILGITKADSIPEELDPVWRRLSVLFVDRPNVTPAKILDCLNGLIGYGRGLTPSGDDFITGLLLASARWGDNIAELGLVLSQAAYQKTTTLSANLIECAAAGQADERLIGVVNAIAYGDVPLQACVQALLSYGNSSGADTLAGIALATQMKLNAGY